MVEETNYLYTDCHAVNKEQPAGVIGHKRTTHKY